MKDFIKLIYILCLPTLLIGCSSGELPVSPESGEDSYLSISDIPISLAVSTGNQTAGSRVITIDNMDKLKAESEYVLADEKGLTIEAYWKSDTEFKNYINQGWGCYNKGAWSFRDPDVLTEAVTYYWPKNGYLDFISYLPRKKDLSTYAPYITEQTVTCTSEKGITFSSQLPTGITRGDAYDKQKKEFIYAYTPNQTAADGTVGLEFKHPFASILFNIKKSYRMKLVSIALTNVSLDGSFNHMDKWTPSSTTKDFTITVNKDVPSLDLNFGAEIVSPSLMIPQEFTDENAKIVVSYYRLGNSTLETAEISLKTVTPKWEIGKCYNYNLTIGDMDTEILFKVTVDEWVKGEDEGHENHVDIE